MYTFFLNSLFGRQPSLKIAFHIFSNIRLKKLTNKKYYCLFNKQKFDEIFYFFCWKFWWKILIIIFFFLFLPNHTLSNWLRWIIKFYGLSYLSFINWKKNSKSSIWFFFRLEKQCRVSISSVDGGIKHVLKDSPRPRNTVELLR